MNLKLGKFIFLLLLIISLSISCQTVSIEENHGVLNAEIELYSYSQTVETYGDISITGKVVNRGNKSAQVITITFSAYDNSNTIIGSADGFPAGANELPVNTYANFHVVFFDLSDWSNVHKVTYKIDWLNMDGTSLFGSSSGELTLD